MTPAGTALPASAASVPIPKPGRPAGRHPPEPVCQPRLQVMAGSGACPRGPVPAPGRPRVPFGGDTYLASPQRGAGSSLGFKRQRAWCRTQPCRICPCAIASRQPAWMRWAGRALLGSRRACGDRRVSREPSPAHGPGQASSHPPGASSGPRSRYHRSPPSRQAGAFDRGDHLDTQARAGHIAAGCGCSDATTVSSSRHRARLASLPMLTSLRCPGR